MPRPSADEVALNRLAEWARRGNRMATADEVLRELQLLAEVLQQRYEDGYADGYRDAVAEKGV